MLQATQKKQKNKHKQYVDTNPIEALRDIGHSTTDSLKTASVDAAKDMWAQLLGVDRYSEKSSPKMHGELQPGQELSLADLKKSQEANPDSIGAKPKQHAETLINYHREIAEAGNTQIQRENHEFRQEVAQLVTELRRLASSSRVLAQDVAAATGPSVTAKPGKYHVNFFQWMLFVVRDARMKVENAGSWLSAMQGKNRKKGYWGMAKKHGSSFMLSGERSVSTNVG